MLQYLTIGITYAVAAVAQPGPFQMFLLSQTLSKGWRRTLPAAFGPIISDLPVIIIVLFLLTHVPTIFLSVLQLAGGIFILYLAFNSYKTWKSFELIKPSQLPSGKQTLLNAVIVNLLNPNPYLGWSLVLGPLLLKGWHKDPASGIALLAGFYVTLITGMVVTILLFASAGKFGPKVNRILLGVSAITLTCFGLYEIYSGLSGL
ncbi:MAG: LysE family translocator [Ignavibacteriaceae bacterium]|nr:LysE family translocator [Ignavibacteriaceae bacterium]